MRESAKQVDSVAAERARLEAGCQDAKRQLRDAARNTEMRETEHRVHQRAAVATNRHIAQLNADLAGALERATDATIRALQTNENDFSALIALDEPQRRRDIANQFLMRLLEDRLPAADHALKVAKLQELEAEALDVERLVELRRFELEVALGPVVQQEGQVTVNEAGTVTGQLAKMAAEKREAAALMRDQLQRSK